MIYSTASNRYDAIVVGAGPNGLAAAITLIQAGYSVLVLEAKETIGGGTRTAELTLPGFHHDICSAIHPLALGSPFFRTLPLSNYGLKWILPPAALAHPFDDGTAAIVDQSIPLTAATLGRDNQAYQRLIKPLVADWDEITQSILRPFSLPPRHPLALARFGLLAFQSVRGLAERHFQDPHARAVFAGMGAHSMLPLEAPVTAAFGLVMNMSAHAVGWPVAQGGSQSITDAMASYLRRLGGEVVNNAPVKSITDLPKSRITLFDVTPRQLLKITGDQLPHGYRRQLKKYRYGPGVCKVDFALDGPIPWKAKECIRAGAVHVGGTLDEISAAERTVWLGKHPDQPFVLVAQQSLFDPSRTPQGKHTCWAYCHVPNGSPFDMTDRIEKQIERFAPGFRDLILARNTHTAVDMELYNPNYVGGDINGGAEDWRQLFTRPVPRLIPYATPSKNIYLCSSATPPGGGVHGMCGANAAEAVLRKLNK